MAESSSSRIDKGAMDQRGDNSPTSHPSSFHYIFLVNETGFADALSKSVDVMHTVDYFRRTTMSAI
jgi:hypothetical protein